MSAAALQENEVEAQQKQRRRHAPSVLAFLFQRLLPEAENGETAGKEAEALCAVECRKCAFGEEKWSSSPWMQWKRWGKLTVRNRQKNVRKDHPEGKFQGDEQKTDETRKMVKSNQKSQRFGRKLQKELQKWD